MLSIVIHPRTRERNTRLAPSCKALSACLATAIVATFTSCATTLWGQDLFDENLTPDQARAAIAGGADVNAQNSNGDRPLWIAATRNDDPEIIQILIDAGADLEWRHNGKTPLIAAKYNENPEVLQAFLEAVFELDERDNDVQMPLMSSTLYKEKFAYYHERFTYYTYGDVEESATVHKTALSNYATMIDEIVDAELPPFRVFVYDPDTMSVDEVDALIFNFCTAVHRRTRSCLSVNDVRAGNVCGGICGKFPERSVMAFRSSKGLTDQLSHSDTHTQIDARTRIQEHAIHELTHVFQLSFSAPSYRRDGGDDNEDWRHMGTRWWGEGTASWLAMIGQHLFVDEYPQYFSLKYSSGQNYSDERCSNFQEVATARGLSLTNAVQASDEPWQALWIKIDGRNAYGPIVYDGGVCAVNFLLEKYKETNDQFLALLRVMRGALEYDSWELSFLNEFDDYQTMEVFYRAFENRVSVR